MTQDADITAFAEALQRITRYVRSRTFEDQNRLVTRVQWVLLRTIFRHPGLTVGQLAQRIDVRQATMSQMLDRLEKSSYVERRPSEHDARIKSVFLTKEGNSLIERLEGEWRDSLEAPFARFSPAERRNLVGLMQRLAEATQGEKG